METIARNEVLIRLFVAALLGGIIGWERERNDRAAGLRTHMLVCVGSALVMIVSAYGFNDVLGKPYMVLDPSRIAAQVISGIGFLGAGTIFYLRPQIVRGLTTAAGLWSVAAVGLAAGSGLYFAAFVATSIIFVVLGIIKPLERTIKSIRGKSLTILFDAHTVSFAAIEAVLRSHNIVVVGLQIHSIKTDNLSQMNIIMGNNADVDSVMTATKELNIMNGIEEVISRL